MADQQRIEDLRRRIQRDPASIAFAQLAEELRRAHEFAEAVSICRAGLDVHPEYLSARVTLGRALIELNELDEAQAELERVLQSATDNLAAIRGLGEIHYRRGEFREALAQYRAALALARNDPELEETVDRLARELEPPAPPPATEGLSFDDMASELLKLVPPPPAPPAEPIHPAGEPVEPVPDSHPPIPAAERAADALPPSSETRDNDPAREHAERTVTALEQMLEAIHVARTERRP